MSSDLTLFKLTVSAHLTMVSHPFHDETRFDGYQKERSTWDEYIAAPNEALARAHFENIWKRDSNNLFRIDEVTVLKSLHFPVIFRIS